LKAPSKDFDPALDFRSHSSQRVLQTAAVKKTGEMNFFSIGSDLARPGRI